MQTLLKFKQSKKLQLSRRDSLARTYLSVKQIKRKVCLGHKVASSLKLSGLSILLDLRSYSLKTRRRSSGEECITSLPRLPRSGICVNGSVYELPISVTRKKESGFILLPTPLASDHHIWYSNLSKLLIYTQSGHQRRLIYECQLAGLSRSESLKLYRDMMSFPDFQMKSIPSETQSCLW